MTREDSIEKLIDIMKLLRSEKGCPWDREQTHESIAHNLLEEAYEVYDAIKSKNDESLKEELGDLLLQIVFHSQIAKERKAFDIYDVAKGVCQKLVRRHPHVFGTYKLKNSKDVLLRWEEIKKKEKKNQEEESHSLDSVSKSMPSILYALNVQKKASRLGFDWKRASDVLQKLEEEIKELKESYKKFENGYQDKEGIEEEVGDLFFSAINFARLAGIDPEYSLRKVIAKFVNRVKYVEALASKEGIDLSEAPMEVLDSLWERAKKEV